ncbi:MAG: BofC C-terminal domain-containing protein [Anaerocolumna sp.]
MKLKKALVYFISFFSLSVMFSACYYLSYKNALRDFNDSAVERNSELILSLENNGLLQLNGDQETNKTEAGPPAQETVQNAVNDAENTTDASVPVDTAKEDIILPTTEYTLQTYDIKTDVTNEEVLPTPSYLIGLNREEVIQYLSDYMLDLPLNEFQKGLMSFEVMSFSKDSIVLKKTYNEDKAENKYYLKEQNGYIIAYYGDQKTVFDYTGVSVENLSEYEQQRLRDGIFVKDLDELYALLENYSS